MSYKTFDLAHDVASLVSAINEVVTVSSSLYTTGTGDLNVKFYNNIAVSATSSQGGYWQTVFDSSPTSSLSTALFDLTFGYSTASTFNVPVVSGGVSPDEKAKVYREMASVLLGDQDAVFAASATGTSWNEAFFFLVKRSLMKDELKKGTVNLFFTGTSYLTSTDTGAATAFKQTIGGDYAPLLSGSAVVGLVYYNAGVVVIPASGTAQLPWVPASTPWSGSSVLSDLMASGSIDSLVDGLRAHTDKVAFHNQTNLYSTVYFCRATNGDFNYSSNPTFIDPTTQRILVTSGSNVLQSRTYMTTIGLYDASDNLLAVGKLNKPITKAPDIEAIMRIRLDF